MPHFVTEIPITDGKEGGIFIRESTSPPAVNSGVCEVPITKPGRGIPIEVIIQRIITPFPEIDPPLPDYSDMRLSTHWNFTGADWEVIELVGELHDPWYATTDYVYDPGGPGAHTYGDIVLFPKFNALAYIFDMEFSALNQYAITVIHFDVELTFDNGKTVSQHYASTSWAMGRLTFDFSTTIFDATAAAGATKVYSVAIRNLGTGFGTDPNFYNIGYEPIPGGGIHWYSPELRIGTPVLYGYATEL